MKNTELIVITGQTTTGKTSYALDLAKKINGELINSDSRQVYKYLDVITGKDIPHNSHFNKSEIRAHADYSLGFYMIDGIKLWLYDAADPKQNFSSYDFKKCAKQIIENIVKQGKTPIIVGGSYLYIKHLIYGFDTESIEPDWDLRTMLNNEPIDKLQRMLKEHDEETFKKLNNSDRNNPHRLIRKIEIARIQDRQAQTIPDRHVPKMIKFVGFRYKNREKLLENITKRVYQRMSSGALEEVKSLLKKGYQPSDPGLQTIGYKQLIAFEQNEMSRKEAIDQWITAEVHYAKRQDTFMKKDKNIVWTTKN